jgi:hypothetical protein
MAWEFWVDRGGTFTDIVAQDPAGGFTVTSFCPKTQSNTMMQLSLEYATFSRYSSGGGRYCRGEDGHNCGHQCLVGTQRAQECF